MSARKEKAIEDAVELVRRLATYVPGYPASDRATIRREVDSARRIVKRLAPPTNQTGE